MNNMMVPEHWEDYELLDSGEGEKLEKWGAYVVSRPEPRAIWNKNQEGNLWKEANARYLRTESGQEGRWIFDSQPPIEWNIRYKKICFGLKATEFKHTGVFPEQAVNWEWITEHVTRPDISVLNLFAYTGGATIAAALAGARVTHVDASRPAMMWASENAKLSGVNKSKIRWIQDDVMKFVSREIRRGTKYDAIIMDPPKFGRGAGGEIWKMEDDLPKLIVSCKQLISQDPAFFLVNGYTADLASTALDNLLKSLFVDREVESGELGIRESNKRKFILPSGIFARWSVGV